MVRDGEPGEPSPHDGHRVRRRVVPGVPAAVARGADGRPPPDVGGGGATGPRRAKMPPHSPAAGGGPRRGRRGEAARGGVGRDSSSGDRTLGVATGRRRRRRQDCQKSEDGRRPKAGVVRGREMKVQPEEHTWSPVSTRDAGGRGRGRLALGATPEMIRPDGSSVRRIAVCGFPSLPSGAGERMKCGTIARKSTSREAEQTRDS